MHLSKQSSDRHNRQENDNLSNNQISEHKPKLMGSSAAQDIRDRDLRTGGQIGASSSATGVSRIQKIVRNSNEKDSVVSKTSPTSQPNPHSGQSAIIPVLNEVCLQLNLTIN